MIWSTFFILSSNSHIKLLFSYSLYKRVYWFISFKCYYFYNIYTPILDKVLNSCFVKTGEAYDDNDNADDYEEVGEHPHQPTLMKEKKKIWKSVIWDFFTQVENNYVSCKENLWIQNLKREFLDIVHWKYPPPPLHII